MIATTPAVCSAVSRFCVRLPERRPTALIAVSTTTAPAANSAADSAPSGRIWLA